MLSIQFCLFLELLWIGQYNKWTKNLYSLYVEPEINLLKQNEGNTKKFITKKKKQNKMKGKKYRKEKRKKEKEKKGKHGYVLWSSCVM